MSTQNERTRVLMQNSRHGRERNWCRSGASWAEPRHAEAKLPAPPAVAQKQVGFEGFLKKREIVETPTGLSYNEPREIAARRNAPRRADFFSRKIHSTAMRCTAAGKKITRGHRKKK